MDSESLVLLALKKLACTQKELARQLGVSPTQITKWKNGEYISGDMEDRLRALAGIGEMHPKFVLWAGSIEDAEKWDKLIHFLAEEAREEAETGYDTYPLIDDLGLLCWDSFDVLKQMGVELPKKFPEELDIPYGTEDDEQGDVYFEKLFEVIRRNPYSDLIYKIFLSLNDVYGFYAAYVAPIVDDDNLDLSEIGMEIESCLMELAATKVDVDPAFASNFRKFKYNVYKKYKEWLGEVKEKAFRAGIPLRAELEDMVYASHDELGHEAEAMSLGLVSGRLHPDIYMNELLVGMRAIHQVLPAILKKLNIDESEFQLDTSEFYIDAGRR